MTFKKYVSDYKKLALKPAEFFNAVEKEKEIIKAIKFFFYAMIAFSLLLFIINLLLIMPDFKVLINNIVSLGASMLIFFLSTLLFCSLVYAGVLIYNKGRADFSSLFKVLLYSITIITFYATLSNISEIIFELNHPLIPLTSKITPANINETISEIFNDKIHLTRIIILFLISIISMIHFLIATTIGISITHKIKKLKAFLSIITIPLGLIVILILAFIWVSSRIQGI